MTPLLVLCGSRNVTFRFCGAPSWVCIFIFFPHLHTPSAAACTPSTTPLFERRHRSILRYPLRFPAPPLPVPAARQYDCDASYSKTTEQVIMAGSIPERTPLEKRAKRIFKLVARGSTHEQWTEWLRVPLEHAAAAGNVELFNDLLSAGANASAGWSGGCGGRSLLGAAARGGSVEVCKARSFLYQLVPKRCCRVRCFGCRPVITRAPLFCVLFALVL